MKKNMLRLALHPLALVASCLWLTILLGPALPTILLGPALPTIVRADPVKAGAAPATPPVASVPPDGRDQQGFVIPFTTIPDHGGPLVRVRINGKVDATFLVDTGSGGVFASGSLAKRFGLTTHAASTPFPDGKSARSVTFTSLELFTRPGDGRLVIQPFNVPVILAPNEFLRLSPDLTVDGVIGANFLQNFAVAFDFSARQMILIQPGVLSSAQTRQLGYTENGLPLTASADYEYAVPVLLASSTSSRRVDLQVDTGSKVTTISRDAAQALSLVPEGRQPLTGGTVGYRVQIRSTVSSLSLGGIRLLDTSVLYPEKGDYPALLGMDILKGYKVLLDYPAHKVYLMPNSPFAPVQIKPAVPITPAPAPPPAQRQP